METKLIMLNVMLFLRYDNYESVKKLPEIILRMTIQNM